MPKETMKKMLARCSQPDVGNWTEDEYLAWCAAWHRLAMLFGREPTVEQLVRAVEEVERTAARPPAPPRKLVLRTARPNRRSR
jgi:hypothetical protein